MIKWILSWFGLVMLEKYTGEVVYKTENSCTVLYGIENDDLLEQNYSADQFTDKKLPNLYDKITVVTYVWRKNGV